MWLVENIVDESSSMGRNIIKIVPSLINMKIDYTLVTTVPFEHVYENFDIDIDPDFIYGSTITLRAAAKHGFGTALYISPDEETVSKNIGDLYLNSDMEILDKDGAINYIEDRPDEFFFIKPNADLKSFDGTVVDHATIKRVLETASVRNNYDPSTKICISPIKMIIKEWRVFIVGGAISTFSCYMINRKVSTENSIDIGAVYAIRRCLERFSPLDLMVIDVCLLESGEYKIVEYNTINCSGLYACDIDKLVGDIDKFLHR